MTVLGRATRKPGLSAVEGSSREAASGCKLNLPPEMQLIAS